MFLKLLLKSLDPDFQTFGNLDLEITGLTDDSRKVKKGYLFVAISGMSVDGHDFIKQAIESGASVIVGEKDFRDSDAESEITYIKVVNSRKALSLLASAWWGYPARKLRIIGVTGTDGKTTTSSIIYWLLKKGGKKAGLITSVSAKLGEAEVDTGFHVTNPEPIPLHKLLSEMVKRKLEYAVLEVTSHGLDQDRVWGIPFEIGVLTNITHEHLDYHKNMENYIKAKAKLFLGVKKAILNSSDSSFKQLQKYIPDTVKTISYPGLGLDPLVVKAIKHRFPERYNRFNAEAAYLVATEYGIKTEDIIDGLTSFPSVAGRLEEIKNDKGIKIYIDFAHTPNALKSVLTELKKRSKGKLISVFGCAGERDKKKRPLMGKISTEIADTSVITSEDPRNEKPENIFEEITSEIKDDKKYVLIPERGEAIAFAIQKLAKKGDTVVFCGKGHEKSMAYKGVEYPWSDYEAVRVALKGGVKKLKRNEK